MKKQYDVGRLGCVEAIYIFVNIGIASLAMDLDVGIFIFISEKESIFFLINAVSTFF